MTKPPSPGSLYVLKRYSNIFAQESIFSRQVGFTGDRSIVMFVGLSDINQKVASDTSRATDINYRFIRVIAGEVIGYCPVVWRTHNSFDLWDFLEEIEEHDGVRKR